MYKLIGQKYKTFSKSGWCGHYLVILDFLVKITRERKYESTTESNKQKFYHFSSIRDQAAL